MQISRIMFLFGGRPFGSVFGNTYLNSSMSCFSFPRTSRSILDRISSSRSSTLRERFCGPSFFTKSRFFPLVSPMDSNFIAIFVFLLSYPQTTAKKTSVLFFTSLFNFLTEMICLSRDRLDVPSLDFRLISVLRLPLILPFRVSFYPQRSFSQFIHFYQLFLFYHQYRFLRHPSTAKAS